MEMSYFSSQCGVPSGFFVAFARIPFQTCTFLNSIRLFSTSLSINYVNWLLTCLASPFKPNICLQTRDRALSFFPTKRRLTPSPTR